MKKCLNFVFLISFIIIAAIILANIFPVVTIKIFDFIANMIM